MFTPTPEQQRVIDHIDGHALVVAGPGSGKTVTLIAHVRKLVAERNIQPSDIWVMAFNRDISCKLRERLRKELERRSPEASTIHTFILRQILRHGPDLLDHFEIADSLGESGKTNLLWRPIAGRLKQAHGIAKTQQGKNLTVPHVRGELWNHLRDYWLTSEKPVDTLFDMFNFEIGRCKRVYRILFLDELALKFLDTLKVNPSFRRQVAIPRVVIDEFQDLNPTEHAILQQFRTEGTSFVVFGDDDQAINDFRRAHADYIHEFERVFSPTRYPLSRDRRCPKEILDLADGFVRGLPRFEKPAGHAPHKGTLYVVNYDQDEHEKSGVASIVKKYLSLFPQYAENPQVLVLSSGTGTKRSKSRTSEIIEVLQQHGIGDVTGEKREDPLDSPWGLAFKSLASMLVKGLSPMTLAAWLSVTSPSLMGKVDQHLEKAERLGRQLDFLESAVDLRTTDGGVDKVLCDIEALKERIIGDEFAPQAIIDFVSTGLAGRAEAEPLIDRVWQELLQDNETGERISDTNEAQTSLGARFLGLLIRYIDENIRKPEIGRVHVTTYRKAKGLEADLVVVTAVDSCSFSDRPQDRRLLYVAATRAKRNLVLTFATNISGARRFSRARGPRLRGSPRVFRSLLIPSSYPTQENPDSWLRTWNPI